MIFNQFKLTKILFSFVFLFLAQAAMGNEPLTIVTTAPDIAEMAKKIAGKEGRVEALLSGREDVHFLDAVPTYVLRASRADIFCFMGLELEEGWLPRVLSRSTNPKIQSGGDGYCNLGRFVNALEVPTGTIDRSMGDVHASGNPHFNLSPKALIESSEAILNALISTRPERSEYFTKNHRKLVSELEALHREIKALFEPYSQKISEKPLFIEYHKEFTYFFDAYGIRSFGSIEETPGVPPSARRLAEVSRRAQDSGVILALGAYYTPRRHLRRFSQLSDISYVQLPTYVQPNMEKYSSIAKVQKNIASQLIEALKKE